MEQLIKAFNKERKAHRGKWLSFTGDIDGKPVCIKSFDTWIQVATYKDKRDGSPMGCSVKQLNEWLLNFLTNVKG